MALQHKAHEIACQLRITALLGTWATTVDVTLFAMETEPGRHVGSFSIAKSRASLFTPEAEHEQFVGRAYLLPRKGCYIVMDRIYDRGDVWLVHFTGHGNLLGDAS